MYAKAGPFLDLTEQGEINRVVFCFEGAVARSFSVDRAAMTEAEVRRRFQICERLFRQLRGDLKWGLTRVLDHLPTYLRYELDGQPWEPDARSCWMPEDGH